MTDWPVTDGFRLEDNEVAPETGSEPTTGDDGADGLPWPITLYACTVYV